MKQDSLSASQIEFVCARVSEYVRVCLGNGKVVTQETVEHSSLLRRLLAGFDALPDPPPLRFGLPSYELVESEEVQVERVVDRGDEVIIDDHDGYEWLDKDSGVVQYPRLGLKFVLVEREVLPDPSCIQEGCDPDGYKYKARFLKRLK